MEADETRQPFNTEAYAAAALAQGKTLDTVQSELSKRLQQTQRTLFSLINQRYEDFLGLSTSLTGIDTTIDELRAPLTTVKHEIHEVSNELQTKLEYMDSRLAYRAQLREKKQVLRLFLDLEQLLNRVGVVLKEAEAAKDLEHVTCLERAAVDVSQIRYFARKGSEYPYVVAAQQRIQHIEESLLTALEQSLRPALEKFLEQCATQNDMDPQARQTAGTEETAHLIAQTLRAYSTVEETERAEDIMRTALVRPTVSHVLGTQPGRGMGLEPEKFASMLRSVLQFAKSTCVPLVKSIESHLAGSNGSTGDKLAVRVVWRELSSCIMEHLPLVFVPGMPERFHKNYREACVFVSEFSHMFSLSNDSLMVDPVYVEFSRKWQLSAYFSIQKKHVIAVLEDFERGKPLDAARGSESNGTRPSTPAPKPQVEQDVLQIKHREGLLTEHAARAVWAIQQCWTSNVYLEALAAKFWQLSIQILLWYQQAASQCVQQLIQSNASKSSAQALESHELDELLHHMHDMFAMREVAMEQTRAICRVVPGTDNGSCGISAGLESAVGQALAPLDDTSNKAADHISSTITAPSTTTLASHLRRTTSQFRHTNRPPPSTPSPYISSLFAYLESTESKITHDQATSERIKHMLRSRVATRVSQEFARVCADALATISKTEASLLRLRESRGSNVRVDVGDVVVPSGVDLRGKVPEADNDKIRRQIWLDVDQVARIVRGYGVETDPEFARFVDLIQPFGI
ncbi:hypothetical protein IWW43_003054 [Coemansia sp. RSA 1935]|nr:hypothetical protein J3F82_002118 [Coemansia sp. RSA 637]KAJ2183445.1 hypothetical protein GGF45_000170 [Coemansia sp. RSA 551]KAJ2443936.1 hypothetical protein IWW46_002276 [Coemansia sp. RSA 2440]KAJ2532703.1 hypothetical protein IWW43_003054 [Coemansia sp. RSA 1935]